MSRTCFVIFAAASLATIAVAQEVPAKPSVVPLIIQKGPELNSEPGILVTLQGAPGEPENAVYMREMIGGGETVKGAPYTATAITESTQVLGDGNRIVHKNTAFVARDGQGRTRREENFGELGSLKVESGKIVLISDPNTSTDYILNPDEQMARVVKRDDLQRDRKRVELEIRKRAIDREKRGTSGESSASFKAESLGTQVIEGVSCEGRRETKTIPAGAIGNERPLEITSESWTSSDLHLLVLRKRNDPRIGETVYRLTNVKLGEPDPSLFQVPTGYKTTTVTEPRPSKE